MDEKKRNGIFYTPAELADYLVSPLIYSENQKIMDPSYGEGSLLLAAERSYLTLFKNKVCQLYGCDIKPVNGLLNHIPEANLIEVDFFDFPLQNTFDTIVMNPPYVRHHFHDSLLIRKYRSLYDDFQILNNRADLWTYFLIKAVLHLNNEGNIGAILPWSFLHAGYSVPLRKWLIERFQFINVVAFSKRFFNEAEERIIVLWLRNYKSPHSSIRIDFTRDLGSVKKGIDISKEIWSSSVLINKDYYEYHTINLAFKHYGFTELHNYADIKIGVVTGADDYFIKQLDEALELGFQEDEVMPIITKSSEFPTYIQSGCKDLKVLLKIDECNKQNFKSYILKGVKQKINLRAHSQKRKSWYSVKIGSIPQAFFSYRASKIPYMILNDNNVQCTNSIHRVYFHDLSELEMKWAVISTLSAPAQLSIETNSKSYGGGVLKIEPKALKNTIIFVRNDISIENVYSDVIQCLIANNKDEAMKKASDFIYKKLNFPESLIQKTEQLLYSIQSQRLNTK